MVILYHDTTLSISKYIFGLNIKPIKYNWGLIRTFFCIQAQWHDGHDKQEDLFTSDVEIMNSTVSLMGIMHLMLIKL